MIFSSYLVTTATVLFETRQKQILKKLSLLILSSSTDVYTKMLEGQYGIILPWHGLGVHKRVNIHS